MSEGVSVLNCNPGGFLTTAAALTAIQVAQGRTSEELALLATFFTALGDNIALMAVSQDLCPNKPLLGNSETTVENGTGE